MLRETGPETAGLWPRTAARLIRLASERAADDTLEQNATGDDRLPGNDADTNAGRGPQPRSRPESFPAWSRLSDATHPYPYELAPTAGELRRWHSEVTSLVGLLDPSADTIQLIQQTMMSACSECARGTTGKRDQPAVLPLASRPRVPSCPEEADRGSRPGERAHRHATRGRTPSASKSCPCHEKRRMSRSIPRHNPPARGRRASRRPGAGRALFTAGRGTTMSFRSRAALRRARES
jgi:hypothetical protein